MQEDAFLGIECVLPEQLIGARACSARHSSTHRLMLGVLSDAVDQYQKACDVTSRMAPSHRREILAWFRSRDRRWLFSFERICEALALESEYVRRGLDAVTRRPDGLTLTFPSVGARWRQPPAVGGLPDRVQVSS